jgi:hypothetical protein
MRVGANVAHGHVLPCGVFDAARTEEAGGVAVNHQAEHHLRRILSVAGAAVVDAAVVGLEGGDRINDEVGEVIFRDPVLNALGKQHRCLTVYILKTGSHASWLAHAAGEGQDRMNTAKLLFPGFPGRG